MEIIRVLNTNAVLVCEKDGEETVLLGAGIGYKKKPGNPVNLALVEKHFVLKERKHQDRFQELLNSIPRETVLTAEQIISLGKRLHGMKLGESIHLSLADHIHTAILALQQGIAVPNSLLMDIKRLYPSEYQVGLEGLKLIEENLGFTLAEDEAGFIALHFINAQYGGENANLKKIIQLVQTLNDRILKDLQVTPDQESLNYYRYMTHLKFFAQRVVQQVRFGEEDWGVFDKLLLKYPREYLCSKRVARYIQENYNYTVGHDEIIYLTVHLAHLTN